MNRKYKLAIDLGGTEIKMALVSENYEIVRKTSASTCLPLKPEELAERIFSVSCGFLSDNDCSFQDISGVGIGIPGTVHQEDETVDYANNLGLNGEPFVRMLRNRFPVPLFAANDGDAAALGEYIAGAGKGKSSLLMVTLGTGIGGGLVIDGKIWSGFNNGAMEIGHMVIHADGKECNCGRRGCFEVYGSATALVKSMISASEQHPESKLGRLYHDDPEHFNGKIIYQLLEDGDALTEEVFSDYIQDLSVGVTNLIIILQPEILVIGGGISNFGSYLLDPIRKIVSRYCNSCSSGKNTEIKLALLHNDAGLIGAAALT